MFRTIWEWFIFLLALVFLVLVIFVSNLLLLLIAPIPRGGKLARRIISGASRIFFGSVDKLGVLHLDTTELQTLKHQQGLIIISNHPSLMDAMLFVGPLPQLICVMKASIGSSPIWMFGARVAGYLSNRNTHRLIEDASQLLRQGENLLVFPEGTRTRTSTVNELKGGFGLIAKKSQAPVQTVILETNSRFLQKGWPIWRKPRLPLRYGFRVGKVFPPEPATKVKDFVREVENYYHEELNPTRLENPRDDI